MAQMTRDEFNRAFGAVVKAIREARGLSQEEVDAGLRAIKTPEQEDEHLRTVAGISAVVTSMREEQRLTEEQLAERSQVPVEFVRNLETAQDLNPDSYYLYCLAHGLGVPFSKFWQRVENLLLIPEDELPGMMMRTTVGRKNCERRNE
jgi:transcriptional regulator with XRE-family HTH domain